MKNSNTFKLMAFLFPFLASFAYGYVCHSFATFGGSTFDPPGIGWLILNGFTNGTLLGLLSFLTYTTYRASPASRHFNGAIILVLILLCIGFNSGFDPPRDRLFRWSGYSIFSYLIKNQSSHDPAIPEGYLAILPPCSTIEVFNDFGKLEIVTGSGLKRKILLENSAREIILAPYPNSKRLVSHLGGERFPGFDWKDLRGIKRCNYIEETIDFPNEEAALKAILDFENPSIRVSTSPTGLVIGFSNPKNVSSIEPDTLVIAVWQITLSGKNPVNFPKIHSNSQILIKSL